MSAQTRITLFVSIDPPVPMVLQNYDGKDFQVRTITQEFTFRDGGWTPYEIKASGKRIKKDGSPSAVSAKSVRRQEFSPEIQRRLKAAFESAVKAAAKVATP